MAQHPKEIPVQSELPLMALARAPPIELEAREEQPRTEVEEEVTRSELESR